MEVLDREALAVLLIQGAHTLQFALGRPPERPLADPTIDQAVRPVIENDKLVGTVTRADVCRAVVSRKRREHAPIALHCGRHATDGRSVQLYATEPLFLAAICG